MSLCFKIQQHSNPQPCKGNSIRKGWVDGAVVPGNSWAGKPTGIGVYLLPAEPGGQWHSHRDAAASGCAVGEGFWRHPSAFCCWRSWCWPVGEHAASCVQGALEPLGFRDSTHHISVSLLPVDSSRWQQETRAGILEITLGCHSWQLQCQEFLLQPLGGL